MLGACQGQGEHVLALGQAARGTRGGVALAQGLALGVEHLHQHLPLGQARGQLNGLGDAAGGGLLQGDAVHHHVDEVLDLLVEGQGLAVELHYLAVDAHAAEALLLEVGQQLGELALAAGHHRRHDDGPGRAVRRTEGEDLVGHLVGGLAADLATALGAVGHAHPGEQQAQVVVDLGGGAHRGARVLGGGLLVDGHRRRQAVDGVQVGLVHLPEEHAGVAGQALHVAALAFGVDGVEGQARLARARQPRDDHQLVARDGEVDVLEVVLAGALDDYFGLCHGTCSAFASGGPSFRKALSYYGRSAKARENKTYVRYSHHPHRVVDAAELAPRWGAGRDGHARADDRLGGPRAPPAPTRRPGP